MNRLNAKRIGVLAASLLFGLAVAGPVSYSSIPIINSAGQPVVQIVVGSTAQPSDGVVAANIAAVIGNLAFTSTPVTATVSGTNNLSCVVTTATCSVSNQQVWLGEAGVAAPTGSYGFTALIGSVLNQGDSAGSLQSGKVLQANTNYAYAEGTSGSMSTTSSPLQSPYTGVGSVPTGASAPSGTTNGGGVTFQSFTSSSYDNVFEIATPQLPSLLSNAGSSGESEYLWLTGFPVYDQSTSPSVQNFALMSAGGAYQAVFTNPIEEPYYATSTLGGTATGTNSINNAVITLLGQTWTIINYGLPSGSVTTSTMVHGGKLALAASLVSLSTVYVGKNLTSGKFTVQLADLGNADSDGYSPAAINVYYNGVLTNSSSIPSCQAVSAESRGQCTVKYNVTGQQLYVKVNQTFAGLYAYQKWAKMQLYSGVYNVTDGQTFNQTRDPGWNILLYWTNTTGSTHGTSLKSVIIYNVSPTMLTPGQSFTFIQNPKVYKVTVAPDTFANFDALSVQSQYTGSVTYTNACTGANCNGIGATGKMLGAITNVTEPSQELIVTSQIGNAFTFSGQTTSTVTYLLTPYSLAIANNALGATGNSDSVPVNVVLTVSSQTAGNFITTGHQLAVTLSGYSAPGGASTQATVYFSANSPALAGGYVAENNLGYQPTTSGFFNITGITLNRALPGLTVTVYPTNAASAMATLSFNTTPGIIYSTSSHTGYYSLAAGTSGVTYNQQNGQPTTTFLISSYAIAPNDADLIIC